VLKPPGLDIHVEGYSPLPVSGQRGEAAEEAAASILKSGSHHSEGPSIQKEGFHDSISKRGEQERESDVR